MNFSLTDLKSHKRGFSLIEVVVSVTIFIVVMIGVTALISLNITNAALLRNRLIAANLAQEGIEIVRNIRDNNFLAPEDQPVPWNQNLGNGDWRVAYDSQSLLSWNNQPLRFHPATGLFDYNTPGNASIFRRTVNIQQVNVNEIKVTVTVNWEERGKPFSLSVEDHLFNWK